MQTRYAKQYYNLRKIFSFMKKMTLFTAVTLKTAWAKVVKQFLENDCLKVTLLPKVRVLYNFGK